jgi:hypothetical protein
MDTICKSQGGGGLIAEYSFYKDVSLQLNETNHQPKKQPFPRKSL